VNIHRITETHRHVVNIYYARWKAGEPRLAEREHREIRWFTRAELHDPRYNIKPDVLWYAEDALDRLAKQPSFPALSPQSPRIGGPSGE
jgi:ADP-ribose pyrophosphatase YjhB (NUDIX family)